VMLKPKKFNSGDKIVPLPESDFIYPLKECIMEVEYQMALLIDYKRNDDEKFIQKTSIKDTYVHLWRTRDLHTRLRIGRKSFCVDSRYFRLMERKDMADFMLDDL